MLLHYFLLVFLVTIDDLLPPSELSVLSLDILSSLGVLVRDYRLPLRFATLLSFCSLLTAGKMVP